MSSAITRFESERNALLEEYTRGLSPEQRRLGDALADLMLPHQGRHQRAPLYYKIARVLTEATVEQRCASMLVGRG